MRHLIAEVLDELDLYPKKYRKHHYRHRRRSRHHGGGVRHALLRRVVRRLIGGKSYGRRHDSHGYAYRRSKRYRYDYDD